MKFAEDKYWLREFTQIKSDLQNPSLASQTAENKKRVLDLYRQKIEL